MLGIFGCWLKDVYEIASSWSLIRARIIYWRVIIILCCIHIHKRGREETWEWKVMVCIPRSGTLREYEAVHMWADLKARSGQEGARTCLSTEFAHLREATSRNYAHDNDNRSLLTISASIFTLLSTQVMGIHRVKEGVVLPNRLLLYRGLNPWWTSNASCISADENVWPEQDKRNFLLIPLHQWVILFLYVRVYFMLSNVNYDKIVGKLMWMMFTGTEAFYLLWASAITRNGLLMNRKKFFFSPTKSKEQGMSI